MERRWAEEQSVRRIVIGGSLGGQGGEKENATEVVTQDIQETRPNGSEGGSTNMPTGQNSLPKRRQRVKTSVAPWRWRVDVIRGLLQVVVALVGYLL